MMRPQKREKRLRDGELPREVDIDLFLECLHGKHLQRSGNRNARVVDKSIGHDVSRAFGDGLDGGLDGRRISDVQENGAYPAGNGFLKPLTVSLFSDAGKDVEPVSRQPFGAFQPYP